MAQSGATTAGTRTDADRQNPEGRTPAQWFAYLVGAVLVLVGIVGFFADSGFDTGTSGLTGDELLGIFEVNGWHNVVHILTGLLLLGVAGKRKTAKAGVLLFGVAYGLVTLIGLIDGEDVLGLFPVNPADNVLHIALTATAILAALASDAGDRGENRTSTSTTGYGTSSGSPEPGRYGRDVDPLTGAQRDDSSATH